ncbi:RNA polymerase sigma factor ShbA [Herbihabitans rhizosphaerae]|nr:RNA polymerase sigma factor ShbA [Herbihabitans rhizosphaerae]
MRVVAGGKPAGLRELVDAEVPGATDGDPVAIDRLFSYLRPLVLRYCRARLGNARRTFPTADDVAQEVCVAVFRALPGYQNLGRPFMAFVYGIAAHKVADAHRAVARDLAEPTSETPEMTSAEVGPEQLVLRGELTAKMHDLLAVLPARQREILILRVAVGLTADETAVLIDSTPGAVRVAQHRALTRLRAILRADQPR